MNNLNILDIGSIMGIQDILSLILHCVNHIYKIEEAWLLGSSPSPPKYKVIITPCLSEAFGTPEPHWCPWNRIVVRWRFLASSALIARFCRAVVACHSKYSTAVIQLVERLFARSSAMRCLDPS